MRYISICYLGFARINNTLMFENSVIGLQKNLAYQYSHSHSQPESAPLQGEGLSMGPPFGSVVAFSSPDRARFFDPEFVNVILPLYSGSAFVLSPNPWCPVKKSFCPSVVILFG